MTVSGKVAIVTGAAQGIGAAFAAGLVEAGASVVLSDVADPAPAAAALGDRASAIIADVTDPDACDAMVAHALDCFGRLDILINNAALFATLPNTPLFDLDPADWDRVMAVNVKGVWLASRSAAPAMTDGGAIVNIATNRIFKGVADLLHYDASKGAVLAMTRSMARELGPRRIRVNAIAPGLTLSEGVLKRDGIRERAPVFAAQRALARDQLPEDLVGAAIFLASDAAGFMTGQTLVVDGGGVMH